ncbi:glycoprotein B [Bovine gammaherpesvirus 6]|uniref:Glycoprotein B n=2 Tax=Bovine gammaherpesvirus 6 TaxID=1504288 RepID=A0A060D3L5_9GAMA|nr:glycoprotein B [Bovine gammaherpesvirus 6]AIB03165.1 glycoprotein B [Bovine gammaherpesvirus 6]
MASSCRLPVKAMLFLLLLVLGWGSRLCKSASLPPGEFSSQLSTTPVNKPATHQPPEEFINRPPEAPASKPGNETVSLHNKERSTSFPYRVCSASATGDIFRFDTTHTCPDTHNKQHNEGILLVYKENLIPYMFQVRKYKKIVTTSTVYNGIYSDTITNQHVFYKSVPEYEYKRMDTLYQCYNSMQLTVAGNLYTYTDRDGSNITVDLNPVDGLTSSVRRYCSQPDVYTDPGWFWGSYRRRTTVNCEITDMQARSTPPFHYFVTSTGETVEMSPFWRGGSNETEHMKEKPWFVTVQKNYRMVDYENRGSVPNPHTRIFIDKEDYTLSWESKPKKESYCPWAFWRGFHNGIQTQHNSTYHFVANEITASFFTPHSQYTDFDKKFPCLKESIEHEMSLRLQKVNNTHQKSGQVEYYKTDGGLILVWQSLVQQQLVDAKRELDEALTTPPPHRRVRRNLPEDETYTKENAALLAQIQYAYDSLRTQINNVLEELSRAWCREQQRATLMWNELIKINPTSVMTSIYGKPVSAKRLGDAISVSQCVVVDQSSVSLHKSMRQSAGDGCYSRPLVKFKFLNDTNVYRGQLGVSNEILLTTSAVEACHDGAEHYFQGGAHMYKYKNYEHTETIPLSAVSTLNTFIVLNLTLLENIDFHVIELYSREEKRLSSVFDIETMFREYNYYTHRMSGIKKDLNDLATNRNQFIDVFGSLMDDLGGIGKTVINAVSGVATMFESIVTGIVNFIKNPFGGMLVFGLIIVVIIIVFMLNRKARNFEQDPVKVIYPDIQKIREQQEKDPENKVQPISKEELDKIMLAMHDYYQKNSEHEKNENNTLWDKAKNVVRRKSGYRPLNKSESIEMLNNV